MKLSEMPWQIQINEIMNILLYQTEYKNEYENQYYVELNECYCLQNIPCALHFSTKFYLSSPKLFFFKMYPRLLD